MKLKYPNSLAHSRSWLNYTAIEPQPAVLDLHNMNLANEHAVYITAKDDPSLDPDWMLSEYGRPRDGYSQSTSIIVVVPKGDVVDAFYFYFYSFNLGNAVLLRRYGNHVGDWEHSLVRFRNGIPEAVYCSEHAFGSAYKYACLEHEGVRVSGRCVIPKLTL